MNIKTCTAAARQSAKYSQHCRGRETIEKRKRWQPLCCRFRWGRTRGHGFVFLVAVV